MKSLVTKTLLFDTGPIISLVTNNMLWLLEPLEKQFKGDFYITENVKKELIDKALKTKRFEYEALQLIQAIRNDFLTVLEPNKEIKNLTNELLKSGNHSFKTSGNWMNILQDAEVETLAAASILNSSAVVIDERTIRVFLENSRELTHLLELRLHQKVIPNLENIKKFKNTLSIIKIIRSVELITIAYKIGLFKDYLPDKNNLISDPKSRLLDAALWAVKVRGCSVSGKEIDQIIKLER